MSKRLLATLFVFVAVELNRINGQFDSPVAITVNDGCPKVITSPNYPNGYADNVNSQFEWDVSTGNDKLILISFTDMQLDASNCDTNVVLQDSSGSELARYCGAKSDLPEVVMTNSNAATLIFNVGLSPEAGKRGFRATVLMFRPLAKVLLPSTAAPTTSTTALKTTTSTTTTTTTTTAKTTTKSTTTAAIDTTTSARPPVSTQPPNFHCGVPRAQTLRIINGQSTIPGEFPWMLQLRYGGYGAICGATLVSPRFAISAFHCFGGADTIDGETYKNPTSGWLVQAGAYIRENSVNVVNRRIAKVHVHPDLLSQWSGNTQNWSPSAGGHDIVVLELDQPIYPAENISYMCLPNVTDYSQMNENTQSNRLMLCQVTGWGVTLAGAFPADTLILQKVSVALKDHNQCINMYKQGGAAVLSDMICAANITAAGDSCQGDSGGPIQCRTYTQSIGYTPWELAGVVSWGIGCASASFPGVYTNVYAYMSWIKSIIGTDPIYYAYGNNF